jgi:hypothetical protein
MNNWCIYWFFTHILTNCTVQEAKSPVKISSGSVARRGLILALKGYFVFIAACSSGADLSAMMLLQHEINLDYSQGLMTMTNLT